MKKNILTALLCLFPAGLYAQQAKPAGTDIKGTAAAALSSAPELSSIQAQSQAAAQPSGPASAKPAAVKPAPVKPAPAKPAAATPAAAAPEPAKAAAAVVPPKETAPSGAGFAVGKKHLVTDGDTLWDLSNKYYKDPFKWGKIYNANMGMVQNPDRIYPKQELLIPDITEEVKPEIKKEPEITGADTVKEADLSSEDVAQAEELPAAAQTEAPAAAPAAAAPAPVKLSGSELSESLQDSSRNDLSEEMPEHQKEWSTRAKILPALWREDGTITAKEKGKDTFTDEGLSVDGEIVYVSMDRAGMVKPGDYLTVYLKSGEAFDKSGKKLGREVQYAGMAEVISADGLTVKARIVDAVTGIYRGYIVKKK